MKKRRWTPQTAHQFLNEAQRVVAARQQTHGELVAGRPYGGWRCILADPPWREEMRSATGEAKSPQAKYRCMTIAELKIFGQAVQAVSALDSLLLMWTTAPLIEQSLEIVRAWGFAFKSMAAWAKESKNSGAVDSEDPEHKFTFGTGYIFRSAAEYLIAATCGAPHWRDTSAARSVRNLIYAPVREHSRKPDEQYAICETLMPGPYLELFSRTTREGWDHFGDEAGTFGEAASSFAKATEDT